MFVYRIVVLNGNHFMLYLYNACASQHPVPLIPNTPHTVVTLNIHTYAPTVDRHQTMFISLHIITYTFNNINIFAHFSINGFFVWKSSEKHYYVIIFTIIYSLDILYTAIIDPILTLN